MFNWFWREIDQEASKGKRAQSAKMIKKDAFSQIRTDDLLITSEVPYQLGHKGVLFCRYGNEGLRDYKGNLGNNTGYDIMLYSKRARRWIQSLFRLGIHLLYSISVIL